MRVRHARSNAPGQSPNKQQRKAPLGSTDERDRSRATEKSEVELLRIQKRYRNAMPLTAKVEVETEDGAGCHRDAATPSAEEKKQELLYKVGRRRIESECWK